MNGTITVNGTPLDVEFDSTATLLDVLREHGHTEVKRGCSSGECGSCLVLVDGKLMNSCQVFAASATGRSVVTTTGLTDDGSAGVIHQAYADTGAVQCGFCTPGMVMATKVLLDANPDPSEEEIRTALQGNLCRCTGYVKIFDAVRLAAGRMQNNG